MCAGVTVSGMSPVSASTENKTATKPVLIAVAPTAQTVPCDSGYWNS